MTTVDMEAKVASRGEETGTGEAEGDMGVVVGMIPEEEVEGITGMEGMTGVEEMIGVVVDTVGAAVVATVVGAETTEVVEEALEVEEIEEEVVVAMVEAETTEVVVEVLVEEGIEAVVDLGEVVTEEGEDLGVALEVMMVVVVGTKKFHRRTRSSCRSKYGIDMVIQSYFALFIIELCFGKNSISKLCPPNV